MKKTLLIALFSAVAAGAYAQGTVLFSDRLGDLTTHIYAPQTATPTVETMGNTSTDVPAGTTVYTGGLLGGASGAAGTPINYTFGNNFSVQIMALAGLNNSLGSLQPVSQYLTTMRQTSQAAVLGTFITPSYPSGDNGIPNTPPASPTATVAVAAWYNAGGTITSLSAAQAAQMPWGESAAINIGQLGENVGSPPPNAAEMTGLTSFSLLTPVPEPSTIALGVMGISAFLIRRRK